MNSVHTLEHHQYDLLLKHKNPLALRMNDANHQQIKIGDIVEVSGHNNIMDRQRFKVVDRMQHPTVQAALDQINHSGLDVRSKLKMSEGFLHAHGPEAAQHPVVSLHLAPHAGPSLGSVKFL
jgi:ASC-1-like (ASCH) protein